MARLPILFLLSLLFLCLLSSQATAQQLPLFSLYRENQGLLNPAAVSSDFLLYRETYRLSAGITHRSQWVGSAGKSSTQSARAEYIGVGENAFAPIVGTYLLNNQVGPTSFTGVYGRIASLFGLEHPNFGGFSAGINAGLVQFRIKASEIDLLDPDDILGQTDQSQWHPDVGLGFYFYKNIEGPDNKTALVYAGISATQLIGLDLTFTSDKREFPYTRQPHFYALAGLYKFLDAQSFIEFSSWIRYVEGVPLDMDVNVRYQKEQKFWVGGGGALSGRLHAELGVYLLHLLDLGRPGEQTLVKLSTGFDYSLIPFHNQTDRAFEINISVLPRW
ncbi:MAG TPA: PorP/SprF family type IX secretion system membrane protein [Clostridia bacterium]|nr:PorP/SprF family type IX secretion system membrane protein [Clostridia bacterium]